MTSQVATRAHFAGRERGREGARERGRERGERGERGGLGVPWPATVRARQGSAERVRRVFFTPKGTNFQKRPYQVIFGSSVPYRVIFANFQNSPKNVVRFAPRGSYCREVGAMGAAVFFQCDSRPLFDTFCLGKPVGFSIHEAVRYAR